MKDPAVAVHGHATWDASEHEPSRLWRGTLGWMSPNRIHVSLSSTLRRASPTRAEVTAPSAAWTLSL